jgi:putative glutamine amidotransferase
MASDRAPRILVTTSHGAAATEYLDALREAGAEPVLIDAFSHIANPLDGMAGLLLTGGGDVDPAAYGAPDSPLVEDVDSERDQFEMELVRQAHKRGTPTLCICRGLQVANVAFGGTLIADIPSRFAGADAIAHNVARGDGSAERGLIPGHVVRIDSDSTLARIMGSADLHTGARHHQSVDRCAGDLRVVARTDDGVVEALELRARSHFWLAVQWHPESTCDLDDGASKKLFRAFLDAAGRSHPTAEESLQTPI